MRLAAAAAMLLLATVAACGGGSTGRAPGTRQAPPERAVFRGVELRGRGSVELGQPLGAADALFTPIGLGVSRLTTGEFEAGGTMLVTRDSAGVVRQIQLVFSPLNTMAELKARYEAQLGPSSPILVEGRAGAQWDDGRTRFRLLDYGAAAGGAIGGELCARGPGCN